MSPWRHGARKVGVADGFEEWIEGKIGAWHSETSFGLVELHTELIVAHLYSHVGVVDLRMSFDVDGMACVAATVLVLLIIKGCLRDGCF